MTKSLIRAARVYKCEMPTAEIFRQVGAGNRFAECMPTQPRSVGLVDVDGMDDLAITFTGGFAFAVRIDTKTVRGDALKKLLGERVAQREKLTGRKPGKKERAEMKTDASLELLAQEHPRTKVVIGFYLTEQQYLILPTTSQGSADAVMSLLTHVFGSLKTTTIHVSSVKQGLTTRLKTWINSDDDERNGLFEVFEPGNQVALERDIGEGPKEKITLRLAGLETAEDGLKQALGQGFNVTSMQLYHGSAHGGLEFTLTSDFLLTAIAGPDGELTAGVERVVAWQQQAAFETVCLVAVIDELCKLFDYVPKLTEDVPAPGGDEPAVESKQPDDNSAAGWI